MSVGAGAMAQAAQEMRRVQREMERLRAQRRAQRQRRMERLRNPGEPVAQLSTQAEFECFLLCGDCGFMAPVHPGPCPSCSQDQWLDLRHHATADQLRDRELAERLRVPGWVTAVTLASAAQVFGMATWRVGPNPSTVSAAAIGVLLVTLLGNRSMAWLLMQRIGKQPHRWCLPIPLPANGIPARRVVQGDARHGEQRLEAPFSGRECLAYQISVLFDAPGDARPPEWVLQEAQGVDFSVDGEPVPGARVLVQKPMELICPDEAEERGLKLARFLRERGLFLSDGQFTLFESRVETGEPVQVQFFEASEAVTLSTLSD